MTPDQLKIKELEAKLLHAQQELRKLEKIKEENNNLRKENKTLKAQLAILNLCSEHGVRILLECLTILREKFPSDAQFHQEVWERLTRDQKDLNQRLAREKYLRRLFLKHSERVKYPTRRQQAETDQKCANAVKPVERSVQTRSKQMGQAIAVAEQAIRQSDAQDMQAVTVLINHPDPVIEAAQPQSSAGRQSLPFEPKDESVEGIHVKCDCGNSTDFTEGAVMQSALRTTLYNIHQLVDTVGSRYQQVRCNHCGRVHLLHHDGDIPVTPTSTMGLSGTMAAAVMHAGGIPLHKVQQFLFGGDGKLGNETLGRNVQVVCREYLQPLVEVFKQEMSSQYTLIADETVINVLQSQGKGICQPAETTRQKDYLAAVCSSNYEDRRIVVFSHLGGRSNQDIRTNLSQYAPKVWVSDAYAAYDSCCDEINHVKHQCCLVHLRRELLDAVNIDVLCKKLNCQTEQQAIERATQELKKDPALFKLCCVIKALSKIYGYEKTVKRDPAKPIEEYFEAVEKNRQDHARILMDNIDKVMTELSDEYLKQVGGKYAAKSRSDQVAKALTYYMNHRDNFRQFVDDPKIPLDSNAVESSIRAVAVLRKACDFKQSVEYTEGLCTLLSVVETAKINGVNDPIEWLTEYAKAYFQHRASNTLTKAVNEDGRSLDSKLMAFDEGAEQGFNFEPWLPWNYGKK